MKKPYFKIIFSVLFLAFQFSFAQIQQEKLMVKGNCSLCKARIEKTAKTTGAKTAVWEADTQILTVEFDKKKTNTDKILKNIADAGHDNQKYLATEKQYNNLPGCCHYERSEEEKVAAVSSHSEKNNQISTKKDTLVQDAKPSLNHNEKEIKRVTINRLQTNALSKKQADLTFNIGKDELLKAACCNLSESFETNATVDVSFSNAVTGSKQLKMLGLDQKYTAITKELLPEIRGLATAYGLNFIPGRWIGSVQLTKGGSTVVNGFESITGQINTELIKYDGKPETSLNVFADFNGRIELNLTATSELAEHWNQTILLHGNGTFGETDQNNDGFLDRPKGHQINASYLINFNDLDHSGFGSHFGIQMLNDQRTAGQIGFDNSLAQDKQGKYGVGIDISRLQLWNKTGYVFKDKPFQSLGWMNQFTYHQQDSFFGFRNYLGKQKTFYSNLIFESIIGNTNHKYKTGVSFLYDQFDENYLTQNYKRSEKVPGLFFEYTLTGLKYTLVAGNRLDFHNLAGTQYSPRINFKYDLLPKTIFRLSAGRGFRTANVFAENQQYFASNRTIEILQNGGEIYGLKPEIAWNYGASLQQEFQLFGKKATIVADFFKTSFTNQVLTDVENPNKIVFYNLEGKSYANSLQTQVDFSVMKNLDFRIAYKYYDVMADYQSGKLEIPFIAKNRGFFNAAFSTKKEEKEKYWSFDTTVQFVGKQRIPDTKSNPLSFQLAEYSPEYVTLNAQVSHQLNKTIRIYLGGENLTNYMQNNPILDAENPFGTHFDGGLIYAPIMGANFYTGVDFTF